MKIKELLEEQENITITKNDLDDNGRLKKQYPDIDGYFSCSNTNITSLEGAPQKVGSFYCSHTNILSLKGAPISVGQTFDCSHTKITSLKGAPQSVGDSFFCFETNITSLEGAPRSVGISFNCDDTKITSLEGAPQSIGGSFLCNDTKITSLKGIGKDFLSEVNGTIDLDGCEQLLGGFLSLLRVKGLKKIRFNVNEEVEEIINKHLEGDRDLLDCKEELMNAGFKEFAKL